jgi:ribitol 2-dehydrogenase
VLNGKTVAITGAASGIGLACARACWREGVSVALVDRDAEALAGLCAGMGPKAVPVVVDLLSAESVAGMLPQILAALGRLDAFHANAGAYVAGPVWEGYPDVWDRMLALNVNAVFRSIHAVLPHMMARGSGDIVATSSIAGHTPVMVEPIYTASKHAVTAFVNAVRRQVLPHGVRVGNCRRGRWRRRS